MKYNGTAVIEQCITVDAEDDNEARLAILDVAEEEFPDADLYLVKNIEEIY